MQGDLTRLFISLQCVSSFELNDRCRVEEPNMSIIQDKLGNEFLRNGSMDPNYAPSMIMLSHLPPVTSFTRLTSQPVVTDLPQEMVLKKERDSPEHGGSFLHSMGIKQEKFNELDYRVPLYGTGLGTGGGKSSDMLDISLGSHQNMLLHDVNINSVSFENWWFENYTFSMSLTCMCLRASAIMLSCIIFVLTASSWKIRKRSKRLHTQKRTEGKWGGNRRQRQKEAGGFHKGTPFSISLLLSQSQKPLCIFNLENTNGVVSPVFFFCSVNDAGWGGRTPFSQLQAAHM